MAAELHQGRDVIQVQLARFTCMRIENGISFKTLTNADLAATVLNSLRSHSTDPYASNWLERLRKLKMLRTKVIEEIKGRRDEQKGYSDSSDSVQDFTDFT